MKTPIAVILVFVAYGLAGQDVFSKTPPEVPLCPPEETEVIVQFQQALKHGQWNKALSFCSARVRDGVAIYHSSEVFFQQTVPIAQFVEAKTFPECGMHWKGNPVDPTSIIVDHCLAVPASRGTEAVRWRWTTSQAGQRWLIEFEVTPLRDFIERATQAAENLRRCQEATDLAISQVKLRLTGLNRDYVVGQPMLFRLELINEYDADLVYDSQQVAVNWSLSVVDATEKSVACIGSCAQTCGGYRRIKTGASAVLFDKLDIARQYDLHKPGRYVVQYRGQGLEIGLPQPPEPGIAYERTACWPTKKLLSNLVTIDVATARPKE